MEAFLGKKKRHKIPKFTSVKVRVTNYIPVYTFVSKHEGEENCYQHGIEKAECCPHVWQKRR
jgi:hypothetical protein